MELFAAKLSTISVFMFWLCMFDANGDVIDSASDITPSDKILSRKRRYLIFPAGSSIQLVYDSVVTIPDYTIYVVTGVTCALSWGLPDQPIYPEDEYMHRYEDGGLPGIQYRNDVNVTELASSTKPNNTTRPPSTKTTTKIDNRTLMNLIRLFYTGAQRTTIPNVSAANVNYANNSESNYHWNILPLANQANTSRINVLNGLNKKNYYYTHSSAALPQLHAVADYLDRNANNAFKKYMADTYFKPWVDASWKMQAGTKKFQRRSTTANAKQSKRSTNKSSPFKRKINKLHTIYPAIGKRNIRSAAKTPDEKFYLDHHRGTRHELYAIIEKYLFAKGYNGTACVLKTLCEVGKKRSDSEPGSFLAEIVRAIFSLPEAQTKRMIDKRHLSYDEAHRDTDDCMQKFVNCPDSIWNAGIRLIKLNPK